MHQLQLGFDWQRAEHKKLGERIRRHRKHCEDLETRLLQTVAGHRDTLRETRIAVEVERWRAAEEARLQAAEAAQAPSGPPLPDSTLPPEGG